MASQVENNLQFIAGLPKAELHLHIEGSLEPELMFELARRNNIEIPYNSVEDIRRAYSFSKLQDFLDIYYQGANVLQTREDFCELAKAYFDRAHLDSVRHAEIFFDPQTHTSRGISISTVIEGLWDGVRYAESRYGITSKLILCFLRHLTEGDAYATLAEAEPWKHLIAGVGLDSSELGNPPEKFAGVFAVARQMGFKIVAHAGEEGPPAYVRQALDVLKVDRLDHGNRALEDDELVTRLARAATTLTVCPLSNLKLCVVANMTAHPIKEMLRAGLRATINSDDPAYFGGYVGANFRAIVEADLVDREDLLTLARNSFLGSFLSDIEVTKHLEDITAYEQSYTESGSHCLRMSRP